MQVEKIVAMQWKNLSVLDRERFEEAAAVGRADYDTRVMMTDLMEKSSRNAAASTGNDHDNDTNNSSSENDSVNDKNEK